MFWRGGNPTFRRIHKTLSIIDTVNAFSDRKTAVKVCDMRRITFLILCYGVYIVRSSGVPLMTNIVSATRLPLFLML